MSNVEEGEFNAGWITPESRDAHETNQLDTVFGLLRAARRRYLLYYLYDAEDEVISVEELVEAVREYEGADTTADDLPQRQSIRTSVVHNHLPRLGAMNVLDYDPRSGTVRFKGHLPLETWLEQARQLELD